jgi:hypothetical protein
MVTIGRTGNPPAENIRPAPVLVDPHTVALFYVQAQKSGNLTLLGAHLSVGRPLVYAALKPRGETRGWSSIPRD